MRTPLLLLVPPLALAAGAFAFAPEAGAIDSLRKRITVDFGDVPCMTRVDKSVETQVPITWTIEQEESYPIPDDEVVGGRSHQILGIARQEARQLPTWVSQADVDATTAKVPDFGVPTDDDIFERAAAWPAEMWTRVSPDSPRLEITNANAQAGVVWDTTDVPSGAYQLVGYTYDPPLNVTSRRDGLFKVMDGDGNGLPAMYIEPKDIAVTLEGTQINLDACIDAAPGSTLTAYIGEVVGGSADVDWQPVDLQSGSIPARGELNFDVDIPFGAGGQPLRVYKVRIDIEDQGGRSYTAYSPRTYNISQDPDAPGETSGDGGGGGGTCALTDEPASPLAWLGLLALVGLGRRRRAALGQPAST